MALKIEEKSKVIEAFKKHEGDTGSIEVQVALLTTRINQLTEHFKKHKKDHASRRGLLMLVGRRATFLRYLRKADEGKYREVIQRLNLRH
jgi:small subunit ribosomal protein S15